MVPTIHYQMGGIPTNIHGQVVMPEGRATTAPWSTASTRWANAPASACTAPTAWAPTRCSTCWCSAARPATTSSSSTTSSKEHKPLPADAADRTLERLNRLDSIDQRRIRAGRGQRHPRDDAAARRRVPHAGLAGRRRGEDRRRARARRSASRSRTSRKVFNTARIEALEVENLIEAAQATMVSAAARKECRGAHTVDDYERPADDPVARWAATTPNWMKHTLWYSEGNRLSYKPVQAEAADGRLGAAQGPHVLSTRQHTRSSR